MIVYTLWPLVVIIVHLSFIIGSWTFQRLSPKDVSSIGRRLDTNEWDRFGAEGQWAPPAWLRPKCALFALFGLIADSGPDVNLIPNTGQVLSGLLVLSKWLLNVTYALSSFYTFFQKWIIKEPGQIHWYCMLVKPQTHFCLTLLYYQYILYYVSDFLLFQRAFGKMKLADNGLKRAFWG